MCILLIGHVRYEECVTIKSHFLHNGGINEKYTFRFENISFRFTIVEHFVLRIIHEVKNDNITINDWFVLLGEMVKRNDGKIKKWIQKINTYNYEQKIFDECISFLESGRLPCYELNV